MKTEKNTLHTLAVYSDCGQHRYLLKKTFDKGEGEPKKVAVIMLHPCARDINEMDTTSMLVANNLLKLGYTEIHMLNVFSKLNADLSRDIDINNTPDNDKTILESVESVDACVICWGTAFEGRKKAGLRETALLKLLEPHKFKVLTTEVNGKQNRHPLTPALRHRWNLVSFEFPKEKSVITEPKDVTPDVKAVAQNDPQPNESEKVIAHSTQAETSTSTTDEPGKTTDEPGKAMRGRRSQKDSPDIRSA